MTQTRTILVLEIIGGAFLWWWVVYHTDIVMRLEAYIWLPAEKQALLEKGHKVSHSRKIYWFPGHYIEVIYEFQKETPET